MENKIIIALDTHSPEQGQFLIKELHSFPIWFKIGMEAYFSLGPEFIHKVKDHGNNVFLDLKLHDIPNTVAQALKGLSHLPIDMVNVHSLGGREMLMRSRESLESFPRRPLLIGVTQLTSSTTKMMNEDQNIPGDILESVLSLSKLARECGLDGVVSSPHEVRKIKEACGRDFLTITPGIRPKEEQSQDQKRITTPKEAFSNGSDFIVIGRPVTLSPSPKKALEKIIKELA